MEKLSKALIITLPEMLKIFGVDNSSSSHADNLQNSFLVLGEGDNFGINRSFGPT